MFHKFFSQSRAKFLKLEAKILDGKLTLGSITFTYEHIISVFQNSKNIACFSQQNFEKQCKRIRKQNLFVILEKSISQTF